MTNSSTSLLTDGVVAAHESGRLPAPVERLPVPEVHLEADADPSLMRRPAAVRGWRRPRTSIPYSRPHPLGSAAGEDGADRLHDQAQGHGAGVRSAEAFSACGRARPIRGSRSLVCLGRPQRQPRRPGPRPPPGHAPDRTESASASSNGTRTSTMVLSPTSARPKSQIPVRAACTASAIVGRGRPGLVAEAVRRCGAARRPHRAPEVPAGLVGPGVGRRGQHCTGPGPEASAARGRGDGRGRAPRCMPMPWSPSPATESIRPSSSACSSIVAVDGAKISQHAAGRAPRVLAGRCGTDASSASCSTSDSVGLHKRGDCDGALAERRCVGRCRATAAQDRRRATAGSAKRRPCRSWCRPRPPPARRPRRRRRRAARQRGRRRRTAPRT